MKIEMKINRYEKLIGEDDLILDNGSCIQVVTQKGAFCQYGYAPLIMSKKLFNELKKIDFIYLDVSKTKEANKKFNAPRLFYFRFNIGLMAESGGYKVVKE